MGLTLAVAALPSCELLIGVDDRPAYPGGGGGGGGGGTSAGGQGGSSTGGNGTGGTSSGGGQGGGTGGDDCPPAPPGCGPDPAPVLKWPDSTPLCYGNKQPPCDFAGEDGAIDGVRGYASTPETITDSVTGLAWIRDAVGPLNWTDADSYCGGTHFGTSDWRLPSLLELLTIIDYGRVPLIHDEFGLLYPFSHWTAEAGGDGSWHYLLLFDDDQGWNFIGGELTWGGGLLVSTHVRCVRGPTIDGAVTQVTECDPQLMRDSRTGLEWQPGPSTETFVWTDALAHCQGLCANGGGWRLASAKELATLYAASPNPGIIQPFTPPGGAGLAEIWTSTPTPTVSGNAFVVDFAPSDAWDYSIRSETAGTPHRAWCVRSYTAP